MPELAGCDELFGKFFDRWYGPGERVRRAYPGTRPDVLALPQLAGRKAAELSPLPAEGREQVRQQLRGLSVAAVRHWQADLGLAGAPGLGWLEAFDRRWDTERVADLIASSDPADFCNPYVVTCCQLGAVLGVVLRELGPGLDWLLEQPYWESALVETKRGHVLPVFHWAIRRLSSAGVRENLSEKLRACLRLVE